MAARSKGLSYQELLDADSRPVPKWLREESCEELPVVRVPIERYVSPEIHRQEVERIWKRTWQMACREEEIPETGDHVVYEVGDLSILVVRSAPDRIQAFHNVCLHRGRRLRDCDGRAKKLRCPFHGWTWKLDGRLEQVPAGWDFPDVKPPEYRLPELKLGTWGGFVFVNPDPEAEPFEAFLGDTLPRHFERWPLEDRVKEVHVAKVMDCNWKVAQEAFMEAYHVVATHPQLLVGLGDCNSQYDWWGNVSRALTPSMTPSPHLEWTPDEQEMLDSAFGPDDDAPSLLTVPPGVTARQSLAQAARMQLRHAVPAVQELCDAELADSLYYTLFPNFHPWAAYNRIVYRFRPWGDDAQRCLMEVMHLAPFRGKRPAPAPVHWLAEDEDWTHAPELGFLTRVFNQDTANLAHVQRGLRAASHRDVVFARYQETKIRHFYTLWERWMSA